MGRVFLRRTQATSGRAGVKHCTAKRSLLISFLSDAILHLFCAYASDAVVLHSEMQIILFTLTCNATERFEVFIKLRKDLATAGVLEII